MYTVRALSDKSKAIMEYLMNSGMIKPNKIAKVMGSTGMRLFVANKIPSYNYNPSPMGFKETLSASMHATCLKLREEHEGKHTVYVVSGLKLNNTTQVRWRHHSRQRDVDGSDMTALLKCNYDSIHIFNKKANSSFKLALNRFTNMPNKEFIRTYVGHRKLHGGPSHGFPFEVVSEASDLVDGRVESAMTEGNDQDIWESEQNKTSAEEDLRRLYERWCRKHSRPVDYDSRFSVFKSAYERVNASNKNPNILHKSGLNQFSDLTMEEFKRYRCRCQSRSNYMTDKGYSHDVDKGYSVKLPASNSTEISASMTIDGHQKPPANKEVAQMKSVGQQLDSVSAAEASGLQGVFTGKCGTKPGEGV